MTDWGRNLLAALAVVLVGLLAQPVRGVAQTTCDRRDFEAVVAEAAKTLRDLNQKNKPTFQSRLRDLKEKRGWSHDQLLKDGAAFVQDATIAEFDERSNATLESIQRIGAEGASSQNPTCQALDEVRGLMQTLVRVQTEKWAYMFDKIEKELAR